MFDLPAKPAAECAAPPHAVAIFWFGAHDVAPGGTVPLRPMWTDRPGSFVDVPPACVAGLALSADAPADLSPDRRDLHVRPTAPHDATFHVRADIAGEAVVGELRVVSAAANPLVGTWRQTEIACDTDTRPAPGSVHSGHKPPVRELRIRGDGTFSVTWAEPFESYKDYWGDYRFDAATGAVAFVVRDGNREPGAFDGVGKARAADGRLVFSEIDFGQPQPWPDAASCTVSFAGP